MRFGRFSCVVSCRRNLGSARSLGTEKSVAGGLADFFVDCFVGFLRGVLGFQKSQFCLKISSKGLMNADKPIKYVIKQAFLFGLFAGNEKVRTFAMCFS